MGIQHSSSKMFLAEWSESVEQTSWFIIVSLLSISLGDKPALPLNIKGTFNTPAFCPHPLIWSGNLPSPLLLSLFPSVMCVICTEHLKGEDSNQLKALCWKADESGADTLLSGITRWALFMLVFRQSAALCETRDVSSNFLNVF